MVPYAIPWFPVIRIWTDQIRTLDVMMVGIYVLAPRRLQAINCRNHADSIMNRVSCSIWHNTAPHHYDDVTMTTLASQITSLTIVYSTVYSGAHQRKHQSSASLAFVRGIHRRPVNSPHKWPVTRKMFPFDDVIMFTNKHIWSKRARGQKPSCFFVCGGFLSS